MTLWQKIKNFFRQIGGKDLPNAVVKEPMERLPSPYHEILEITVAEGRPMTTKEIEQKFREQYLPESPKPPKIRRRHPGLPKFGAAAKNVDLGKFMKGKSKGHHKDYRRSVKRRLQPEED